MAVRIYVRKKSSAHDPDFRIPKHLISPLGGKVPTDVIEVGDLRLHAGRTSVMRPAQPGISVGINFAAGTLGCFVRKIGEKPVYLLSNAHVIARDGVAEPGSTPVFQPARIDELDNSAFAQLTDVVPFLFSKDKFNNRMDIALAQVNLPTDCNSDLLQLGAIQGLGLPAMDMPVQKMGRTTGVTEGVIEDLHFQLAFHYERNKHGEIGRVGFRDQILIHKSSNRASSFSEAGDSGSLVIDGNNQGIGLLFAGSEHVSVCNPLHVVFKKLNLEFL